MNVVGAFYFMIISEMRKGIHDVIRSEKCKKIIWQRNSTTALNNMNLEIEEGEFVAIMGSLAPVNLHCSIS